MGEKSIFYLWDEPQGEEMLSQVKKWAAVYKELAPDIPILVAGTDGAKKLSSEYIDIVCPLLSEINEAEKSDNQQLWWYICCGPHLPYPNFFIDHPDICYRIIPWMCWKYEVKGFLYWNTIAWNNYWIEGMVKDCSNIWENLPLKFVEKNWHPEIKDRWPYSKWDTHTYDDYNGDGQLIYPEVDIPGMEEPISSIRLESIRDGIQDYKYLWLLKNKIQELKCNKKYSQLTEESEIVLKDSVNQVVNTVKEYTKDSQVLLNARQNIAKQIEKIDEIKNKL